MYLYEFAAIFAASIWAVTGMISASPSQQLGAVRFNHLRMWLVFLMLIIWVGFSGSWRWFDFSNFSLVVASGFIGIFLGDTALFQTLNRMGPRRTAILFSLNAPFSVLLGWLILNERLSIHVLFGIAIVLVGVVLAIIYGKRASQRHEWEAIRGPIWIGVLFGIIAALCQSVGSLIMRPIMAQGADPVFMSMLRVGIAAICLSAMLTFVNKRHFSEVPLSASLVARIALSGFLGMGVGMTALLYGFSGGEVGVISTLSATTPVILLPLMWITTREMPALGAWIGAILVVTGSGMIFAG